jgi:probable HAF family extracellular repeat protein
MITRPCTALVTAVATLAALAVTVTHAADSYTATPIPPITGGTGTIAYGVNNAGAVVGQADNISGELVGFIFIDGVSVELPLLAGGSDAQANSVNDANVIVGSCRNASNVSRAVKWENVGGVWTITDLGTFDSNDAGFGVATRINNLGQIAGYCSTQGPAAYHACVWQTDGTKSDMGTLGFSGPLAYSQALGINDAGQVTGFAYAVLQGPEHGLLFTPGTRSPEDITPQEQFGLAQWHSINGFNTLAGYVSGGTLTSGAFMPATYVPGSGVFNILPTLPGTPEGYAYDINDDGTVVGTNFMLAPVPDPNVFVAFKHEGGVTSDLNAITTGQPGLLTEARDISNSGFIAATADLGFGPQAVLLTPVIPPSCTADFNGSGAVDADDLFAFLDDWFEQSGQTGRGLSADVDRNEEVNPDDLFAFLDSWFAENGDTCD